MKKNVLITGATGNLGKATVDRFRSDGYNIIATTTPGKGSAFDDKDIITYEVDLANETETGKVISDIVKKYQTIDAALLLVGGFAPGKVEDADLSQINSMITLNFNTAYSVARPVFIQMKKQNGGRIILVGSKPGLMAEHGKDYLSYALSKSLIFRLAEYFNADGAKHNVVASVIVPGTIDTPANRKAMPDANFANWVSPDEIAATMAFLCSDESKSLRDPVIKIFGKS